jgi:hypothetical protein
MEGNVTTIMVKYVSPDGIRRKVTIKKKKSNHVEFDITHSTNHSHVNLNAEEATRAARALLRYAEEISN